MKPNRVVGLDVLRSIAIVWVILFHAWIMQLGTPCTPVARYGWLGVDLFFVLSGYLIGGQWFKAQVSGQALTFGNFYRRRAFRILPVYFVVLAAYFLAPGWREATRIQPAWQFLTFTENLLIDYSSDRAFSHVWSLCVEEHFYLLFPLIVALLWRPSIRKTLTVAVVMLAAGIFLRASLWCELHALNLPGYRYVEDIYYPTWTRLDGLLAGVLVAALRYYRPKVWQRLASHSVLMTLAGLALSAVAIVLFTPRFSFAGTAFGYPLVSFAFAFLVAAGANGFGLGSRLQVPGAVTLATLSYSLYLSHKLVFHLVHSRLALLGHERDVVAFAAYTLAALLIAAAMYLFIERPFLRWRDTPRNVEDTGQRSETVAP